MRKRYIFWWVISAVCFWYAVTAVLYGEGFQAASLFFLIFGVTFYVGYLRWHEYAQQQEDREALHDYLSRERSGARPNDRPSRVAIFDVVGETYRNDDGSARQRILKSAYDADCMGLTTLEQYIYNGEPAVHVLFAGEIIGNIGRKNLPRALEILDSVYDIDLDVGRFAPEEIEGREDDPSRAYVGGYIYYAKIAARYLC